MPAIFDDPDGCSDASSIAISIFGIFRDGAEHHFPVWQSGCVGQAEGNAPDQTEVQPMGSGRLDAIGSWTLQSVENSRK